MSIEYENISLIIARDVKHYLMRNGLCTTEEADVLCLVYEDQPAEIVNMSWWDVLGLAMKQTNYLFSIWEERARRINDKIHIPELRGRGVSGGLVPAPAGFNPLSNFDKWEESLREIIEVVKSS